MVMGMRIFAKNPLQIFKNAKEKRADNPKRKTA